MAASTPKQRRQQELFRSLGTMYRTKVSLDLLINTPWYGGGNNTPAVKVTPLQQIVLNTAVYVLRDLIAKAHIDIKNL